MSDDKIKLLQDSLFVRLLELRKEGVQQINNIVKILARDFDSNKMEVKVRKGNKAQVLLLTSDDFSTLMEIKIGPTPLEENPTCNDEDLIKKFFSQDTKTGKYQEIFMEKIKDVLFRGDDPTAIKQAFVLLTMHFVVCPKAWGNFRKCMLFYVKDANHLNEHPWDTIAMDALTKSIKKYQEAKGSKRSLGGCTFFLQVSLINFIYGRVQIKAAV